MNIELMTRQIADNKKVFESILANITEEQARWKPARDRWSILEIVNHLSDLEREDFRRSMDLILYKPGLSWPDFNEEDWVTSRRYNQKPVKQSVMTLLNEREQSIQWLKSLRSPNWDSEYTGTKRIKGGDLLAAWLAHDFIHLNQLLKVMHEYLALSAKPYNTDYAGQF